MVDRFRAENLKKNLDLEETESKRVDALKELQKEYSQDSEEYELINEYIGETGKEKFNELINRQVSDYGAEKYDNEKQSYSAIEEKILRTARDSANEVKKSDVMQKVISAEDLKNYFYPRRGQAKIGGFTAKAKDVIKYTNNYDRARENLRLDYNDTVFKEEGQKQYNHEGERVDKDANITVKEEEYINDKTMYVIRYTTNEVDKYYTPYPETFDKKYLPDQPYTGNGYIGSKNANIPEYKSAYGDDPIPREAVIYQIDENGNEKPYGVYKEDRDDKGKLKGKFILYEDWLKT